MSIQLSSLTLTLWPALALAAIPQVSSMPAVNSAILVADDTTQYTVTMTIADGDGYNDLRDGRVLFDYTESGGDGTLGRGYMAWGQTDADINRYGGTWVFGDAVGGGRWGYLTDNWGGTTYITPLGCQMTPSGKASGGSGSRTLVWTFTPKPAWAWNPLTNDVDAYVRDGSMGVGWRDNPDSFDVVAAACSTYSVTPHAPTVSSVSTRSASVAINLEDSGSDVYSILISPDVNGNMYVQADGTLGPAPKWQLRSKWGTKTVTGLMWNTTYNVSVRAARNSAGYCPSSFGPATQFTTLNHVSVIDLRQAVPFNVGVRGQCPYRQIAASAYPALWSLGYGSLARGLAGGLDADTYDWRDISSGSTWGLGGGAYTTLQFLQYARDYQADPMLTANVFGGGYRDAANSDVFVCQVNNPEGLAADWVRYTNFIVQNYHQGDESAMTGEDLRVYNSIANWGGRAQLLAQGESAIPPVKHWEIGNEPEVPGIGSMLSNHYLSPADYRDAYKRISQAMLAVDPTLKFGPCLTNPSDPNGQWLPTLAADSAAPIDFVSYHPYYSGIKVNWGYPAGMTSSLRVMKDTLNNVSAAIRTIMTQNGRTGYGLIASEWNPVNWDAPSQAQSSVANGIGVAETAFTFAEDGVQGATFWEQPQSKLGPKGAFEGLRDYMGDTFVATMESMGLTDRDFNWRVYVTRNASDEDTLMVWGLNFYDDQTVAVDLSIPYCRFDSGVLHRYGNPSGDTSLMTSSGMAWTEQPVTGLDAGHFTFTMQDAEITVLVMHVTPLARVDYDEDGDVDQSDWGHFQACLLGPAVSQTEPGCQDALLDGDDDVDQADAAVFIRCLSGPGVPADDHCTD